MHSGCALIIVALPLILLILGQLETNGFGVCSVTMDTRFIEFGIFIIAIYIGLSIYSIYYFKVYVPNNKKMLVIKKKIMFRYLIYIASTIITWLLILTANIIITFMSNYNEYSGIKILVYIGN